MVTPKVSRGLRVLPASGGGGDPSVKEERAALLKEIDDIEKWWRSDRWSGTKRTFTGELLFMILHL